MEENYLSKTRNSKLLSQVNSILIKGLLKTVKEQGMPFFEKNYNSGNLYIDFEIVFPKALNDTQASDLLKVN